MHLHYAVMLFVTSILATVHAALQSGQLDSPHPNSGNGPVRTQALEGDNDDEQRGGTDLLSHVVKAFASDNMPRVLSRFWTEKRAPPEDVRASLHLEEVRAVESLEHQPWENDVEFARKRKKRVAIMKVLTACFGDRALASRIIELKGVKYKFIRRLAITAQSTQVFIWKEKPQLPKDVFCLLKLDEVPKLKTAETTLQDEVVYLFNNAEFETWTNYVRGIHSDEDLKAEKTMVETLTIFYGDDRLGKILSTAARIEETETEAVYLQEAQLKCWLNGNVDPAQVRNWIYVRGQKITEREMTLLVQYKQDYKRLNYLSHERKRRKKHMLQLTR